jgi:hypothetical protein
MRRKTVARVAAAFGAACLLVSPFATSARADVGPLPVYQATGIGQGVIATFATVPSIFNPLIQAGSNYTVSTIDSQGGGLSSALSAQLYPGSLATGALGCGGSLPAQFLSTTNKVFIKATTPQAQGCKTEENSTIFDSAAPTGNKQFDASVAPLAQVLSLKVGKLNVSTGNGFSSSSANTQQMSLASSAGSVLTIGSMAVSSNATSANNTVQNAVQAAAKNISLLGGAIQIGSLTSTSTASSDGTTGIAKGTLTFADVTALLGGKRYEASIDNSGIHINQPGLSRAQNLGLSEQITDVLTRAGIAISTASPTQIIDGASSEASIGGLSVSIDLTVPAVPVPPELAPVIAQVINQIPTHCLSEFGIPAPICFGPGVLPGLGSEARLTFNIASTDAFAVGGLGFPSTPSGGCVGVCGGVSPPIGGSAPAPPIAPTVQGPQPLVQPSSTSSTPTLRLFGLVARLPAAALLWGGLGLLVLAMGFAYGPSLRHARVR